MNTSVLDQFPPLPAGEEQRLEERRWILQYARDNGVGAEIGVFRGHFSSVLCANLKPQKLFLVDPWWTMYGEYFPSWGEYTLFGKLKTRDAYEEAVVRVSPYQETETVFVVQSQFDFLKSLPNEVLDWVYLDSSHQFDATIMELQELEDKVKPDGVIMGDDFWPDPTIHHYGVFRAVTEFTKRGAFALIAAGPAGQFCLKRMPS